VPAEKRGVSMVFQSYAIWPHMTVFDNVAYGLRVRKLPSAEIDRRRSSARSTWCRCAPIAERGRLAAVRRPAAARRAGARLRLLALVLLFDEPLSNLDAKLRAEMRIELRELQHRLGITSVYVTHDQEEALAISDRIIVMRDGGSSRSARPRTSTTGRAPASSPISSARPI
jgi:iron(III) transport system ATP-binding protein